MYYIKFKTLSVVAFLVLISSNTFSKTAPMAVPPAKQELTFLNVASYESLKKEMSPAPTADSAAQKADEAELAMWEKTRTPELCAAAKAEASDVSFSNLYAGTLGTKVDESQKKLISEFFGPILDDAGFFVSKMKKDFPRHRPFSYIKGVTPCVPTEESPAYPSGHGTISKLYALVLMDLFPSEKDKLEKRGIEIGQHRVQIGVHHPTDIEAGRKLADLLYSELKKSKKYQDRLKKLTHDLKLKI